LMIHSIKLKANEYANSTSSLTITSLHQWLTDKMLSWMPPGRSYVNEAKETPEEGKIRYEKIGSAMISVAYDLSERPLFVGKYGRAKTLALLASIAWFESGYRKDVDLGLGKLSRGDSGKSWCMMQIMLGKPDPITGHTKRRVLLTNNSFKLVSSKNPNWDKAYGGTDLVNDRAKCFKAGLHLIRNSFHACWRSPLEDRLSVYTSGNCSSGTNASRLRVRKAQNWLYSQKPPLTDIGAMQLLHPVDTMDHEITLFRLTDQIGRPIIN